MNFRCLLRGCTFIALSLGWGYSALADAPLVGVLLKGQTAFWNEVAGGAKASAEKTGMSLVIKIPVHETDVSTQVMYCNALGAMDIKALIIAPADQRALMLPIARLAAKGVKIIVLDSPLEGKKWALFVGTDQAATGEQVGKLLASTVAESDEIAVFRNDQNGSATGQREEGAIAALRAAHPAQVIHADVYSGTEPGKEADRAEFLISKYPNIKAIFASSSSGTMGMLQGLQAHNLGHAIKLIGMGFNLNKNVKSAIEAGDLYAWVAQLPRDAGSKSVEAADALLRGQTVPDVIHTDVLFVTKDNVNDPKILALMPN